MALPTFKELVDGFADEKTHKKFQTVVLAGLEDLHSNAKKIKEIQGNSLEGLIKIAFPRLSVVVKQIEEEEKYELRKYHPPSC